MGERWSVTPVHKALGFFSACLIFTLGFAADGFATGRPANGIFGLVVAVPTLFLVLRAIRLARAGVYVDYRRARWGGRKRS